MAEMTIASYVQAATQFLAEGFSGVGTIISGIWDAGVLGQITLLGAGLGIVFKAYHLVIRK